MLIQKIEHVDIESIDGTDDNVEPIGFREITEKEFAQSQFFQYTPDYMESRQIYDSKLSDKAFTVEIFWFQDKTGLALSRDYWEGKMRYFACGCDHNYKELSQKECQKAGIAHEGRCWHVLKCKKCKHIYSVDSSD